MKKMNRILKTIKIPLKFISKIGSTQSFFVRGKKKELVKIISFSNVKIVAVRIRKIGKKIIVTVVFLISIINSSGVENQKISEKFEILPTKIRIERVVKIPCGGAMNELWSPGAKYQSKSSKSSSGKAQNLRVRRLIALPGSNSGKDIKNPSYKKSTPSLNNNIPKSGKGLRVRSIATTNEEGETKTIHYNKAGQIIDLPPESKFLDDVVGLSTNDSPTKAVNHKITKERSNLSPVQDDKLTPEGHFIDSSKLTSRGRSVVDNTKERRSTPLLQSKYESKDDKFLPAYSIQQVNNKNKHTFEVLQKLNRNITKYNELAQAKKLQVDLTIVEELLAHPDTELHMNVFAQGREPIAMILNRGMGNYLIQNHIATFERRPEICKYNSYISNYVAEEQQIEKFDRSNGTSVNYEDLVGNSYTNIGPIFGKTVVSDNSAPTTSSTVNEVGSEL
jgi:hypothetical protein